MQSPDDSAATRQKALSLKSEADALARQGGPENLAKAAQLCDESISLLTNVPPAADGSHSDELAGAWVQRGVAHLNIGAPEALAEATRSFDNAIALLETLPLATNPLYLRHLAIALMNRGITQESKHTAQDLAAAGETYQKVISLLTGPEYAGDGSLDFILAGAWLNSGNVALQASEENATPETAAAAEKAIALVAKTETTEPEPAEIGFKARHVLCRATLALLMQTGDAETRMDCIGKITDTVEDGLRLARDWEKAGIAHFRLPATQLFHLGALIYEKEQPQFLPEFLIDHIDPARPSCVLPVNPDWYIIASESLGRVRQQIHNFDFASLATSQGRHWIDILNDVKEAESRLHDLREGAIAV